MLVTNVSSRAMRSGNHDGHRGPDGNCRQTLDQEMPASRSRIQPQLTDLMLSRDKFEDI